MAHVQFFGDNLTYNLSHKHLLPFNLEVKITSKRALLQTAIDDAKKEYETSLSQKVQNNDREFEKLKELRISFEKITNKDHLKNTPIL